MNPMGRGAKGDRKALTDARYAVTLRRVDFSRADLTSVAGPQVFFLDHCAFVGTDLRQATLDGWRFTLCDLTGADLRGSSLRYASFSGCDLTGADLRGADLTGVRFGPVGVGEGAQQTRLDAVLVDPGVEPFADSG